MITGSSRPLHGQAEGPDPLSIRPLGFDGRARAPQLSRERAKCDAVRCHRVDVDVDVPATVNRGDVSRSSWLAVGQAAPFSLELAGVRAGQDHARRFPTAVISWIGVVLNVDLTAPNAASADWVHERPPAAALC